MTPRFADAVDPILIHAFSLMERIDAGEDLSVAEEKRTLEGLIQQADQRLQGHCADWPLAKYALASWIDEMLVDAHIWQGQDWWRDNVLEWSLFNSRRCNDLYYVHAKNALGEDSDDALQLIYICVMLGFRGLYRDEKFNRMLIDQHGLRTGNIKANFIFIRTFFHLYFGIRIGIMNGGKSRRPRSQFRPSRTGIKPKGVCVIIINQ